MNNEKPTILDVRDLNVYYGESHILRDVNLSFPVGKIVAPIGRNYGITATSQR
jgi:urea transport system ATP-binding protein